MAQMIELTKLDSKSIILNLDLVKYIEAIPDTLVVFLNGDSIIVKESLDDIQRKTIEFLSKINTPLNDHSSSPDHQPPV